MAQNASLLKDMLSRAPVVPVIVLNDVAKAKPLAEALVSGGLPLLEVTLRTENAFQIMEEMATVPGAIVGAGTVRDLTHMQRAEKAGSKFLVSPGSPPQLIADAEKVGIPLLPGVATATEGMTVAEQGYSFVKFFPAEASGGARAVKDFASPLPDLIFCPTGGISLKTAPDYLGLPNVICVGGSWVTPADAVAEDDWGRIETLAREAAGLARS
ncbi:bifunctional 4-hydroxy-2-oxoglutarate aldolase/2-dehydro-3-deoxy-phosphogluconate aldolase [Cucumibacter marinus]|uniref:bifunctional 4-hydroxy-2-oxoglutarate aldolase/2-dehydro-3-deoxy-phosphogluconate aldolase n=1 Tax=Cucumibacter marinus TaxID=1121252 RepID=UPI00040AD64E|nr:bifunctional 4-hydroxy-2-oxoglutarate aldolase/2-dehydro-3-deoxy-phosphogluconate aldolase [Cucumibacter marinus]